jgi:hypothetical protein
MHTAIKSHIMALKSPTNSPQEPIDQDKAKELDYMSLLKVGLHIAFSIHGITIK